MGKVTARNAYFRVFDGATSTQLNTSLNNITLTQTEEAPEVTVFGQTNRLRMHDGIKDWECRIEGYFEGGANEIDAVLFGLVAGGSGMIDFGPTGSTSGCVKYSACSVLNNYEINFALEDAGMVSANFQARTGSMTRTTW